MTGLQHAIGHYIYDSTQKDENFKFVLLIWDRDFIILKAEW